MANTKIPVELSSTPGIVDNSTATAITIDSSEDINLTNHFNTGNNKYVNILDADGDVSGRLRNVSGGSNSLTIEADPNNSAASTFLSFKLDADEKMRIDSSGLVSIGNTVASSMDGGANNLVVGTGSGTEGMTIYSGTANSGVIYFADGASGDDRFRGQIGYSHSDNAFSFRTNASASANMTLDSSGNLLVGTTSTTVGAGGSGVTGFRVDGANGIVQAAASNNTSAIFNRTSSDGYIVEFRKDGGAVGRIATKGGLLAIGDSDCGIAFEDGTTNHWYPWNIAAEATSDNIINIGAGSARFDNIYATNGTIQTSDRNEKQNIEALTDAETRVAVAAKGLLRKFRWQSAVEEKGDEARIHFGIIAQDLQDAFTAEGLDAGDYAMFISDTWTDDDGVEQTRLGVRYSELLAFIIAAI